MSVTLNATTTSEASVSAATTLDFTALTIAAGSNRALVATIMFPSSTSNLTINWDATGTPQALTLIGSVAYGSGSIQLWGLVAPTTGNLTLRASWTGSSDCVLHGQAYDGADQTGGATTFPHFASNTGTGTTISVVITSATDNYTVAGAVSSNDPTSPTQTENFFNDTVGFSSSGSRAAGAATVTHAWSLTSNTWAAVGTDILAAGGGAETITPDKWLPRVQEVRGPRFRAMPSGLTPPQKIN